MEDYTYEAGDDCEEDNEGSFNEEEYTAAVAEYETDVEEYHQLISSGQLMKGLLITQQKVECLLFSERPEEEKQSNPFVQVTAKAVQEAIKAGTATPQLLEAEIDRIESNEKRSKELDREKVQLKVHAALSEQIQTVENNALTSADIAAARLIIFQSLDYSTKRTVEQVLFDTGREEQLTEQQHLFNVMSGLSEAQYSYLIRMAITTKSESKMPRFETGYFLYRVAEDAGTDLITIEQNQQQKATDREDKQAIRIAELNKKIERLSNMK